MTRSRSLRFLALVLAVELSLAKYGSAGDAPFLRGDANGDRSVDLSDAIFTLDVTFRGVGVATCLDALDSNDDGEIDISDPIFTLTFLFSGANPPPPPFPNPGADPTADVLDCQNTAPPRALRHGTFVTLEHGVRGRVEHLDDHTIRLTDFHYDGGGFPEVLVWLHLNRGSERDGFAASSDLRGLVYEGETLVFPIPPDITGEMFGYVSIWCTSFPATYGYARLFLGGFP